MPPATDIAISIEVADNNKRKCGSDKHVMLNNLNECKSMRQTIPLENPRTKLSEITGYATMLLKASF